MNLIKDNGYETISFDELADFVKTSSPLPEKPVIITFDDGYQSNYDYAFPVLREHNMKATIFIIGVSVGKRDYYKNTNHKLTPHFGKEEINTMVSSGLISINSHTFDMHQWAPFEEILPARESLIPFEGESESDFTNAVTVDVEKQDKLFSELGLPRSTVLAYPNGKYVQLSNIILNQLGYEITLSTDEQRINTVISGVPQSLINLGRMGISENVSDKELLDYLQMK